MKYGITKHIFVGHTYTYDTLTETTHNQRVHGNIQQTETWFAKKTAGIRWVIRLTEQQQNDIIILSWKADILQRRWKFKF